MSPIRYWLIQNLYLTNCQYRLHIPDIQHRDFIFSIMHECKLYTIMISVWQENYKQNVARLTSNVQRL